MALSTEKCRFLVPSAAIGYVGALSWAGQRNGATLIGHTDFSTQEQHAKFPINGSGPEVSATHGERSGRCVYENLLLLHIFDLPSRKTEGPRGRTQHDLALAFARIVHKVIDHDVCVLAERQYTLVIKGDLQSRISSRAQPVVQIHRRAHNGGLAANLRLVLHLGDLAHGGSGRHADIESRNEADEDCEET